MVDRTLKSGEFQDIMNPYQNKPKTQKQRLYEKPDPRIKQDTSEDRPIKLNPTG